MDSVDSTGRDFGITPVIDTLYFSFVLSLRLAFHFNYQISFNYQEYHKISVMQKFSGRSNAFVLLSITC